MKLNYETPDIELNKYKFADVMAGEGEPSYSQYLSGNSSMSSQIIHEGEVSNDPFGDGED